MPSDQGWPTALAALALLSLAGPAEAQRRDGPPVHGGSLRPNMPAANARHSAPPIAGPEAAFAAFSDWNRANGRPRLLVLWNRELSDDTASRYRERSEGVIATAAVPGKEITAYKETREQEQTTGGKYTALGRNQSLDLEARFVDAFLESGANLLDRNALMRKVSVGHTDADRRDQQFIESAALEQGVQYLVEVLPDLTPSATGYMFTVKITHVPTSRVHAQFRTAALPLAGPTRLVARPGGYTRETEERNSPEDVAETLAAETMRRFR